MGSLRPRLRKLERETDAEMITVEHRDGSTSKFREDEVFAGCFLHEMERGGRHFYGEEPGPAHPFVVALRTATNLEALMAEHGTMVGFMAGEDEIMRGVRERPGPSVTWNEDGAVCS